MPDCKTNRLTANPIGRILCVETNIEIGVLYLWDTGEVRPAMYSDGDEYAKPGKKIGGLRNGADAGGKWASIAHRIMTCSCFAKEKMKRMFGLTWLGFMLAIAIPTLTPQPAKAYPVDCAILLCLAGGWPSSVECTHARAVFIRRITPWPIEPPLQIWRCPMDVSLHVPLQNYPSPAQVVLAQVSEGDGADIDISGIEFDFVRSIRVWDVRHYSHRERGRDDDCSERFNMRFGSYGAQGEFEWRHTVPGAAPNWVLPSRRCSAGSWRRGVGVEWEDHEGNHGYEWMAY